MLAMAKRKRIHPKFIQIWRKEQKAHTVGLVRHAWEDSEAYSIVSLFAYNPTMRLIKLLLAAKGWHKGL